MAVVRPAATTHAGSLVRAILLLLVACMLLPVMDGIAKHLGGHYPVAQVAWGRYFFNLVLILPFVLWRYGPGGMRVRHPMAQLVRGCCLVGGTYLFFLTLVFLPMADTLALIFLYPLVVTIVSPWALGEQVGWRRITAVAAGFGGALLIIRPGTSMFDPASLLGVATGIILAAYFIITRKLAGTAPAPVTLAFGAVVGAVLLTAVMPWAWLPPSPVDWLLFMSLGAIAAVGHLCFILAYETAPASVLAPLGYAEMPSAVLVGFLFFGDLPDGWTWAGIVVIVASGIFIVLRENRRPAAG